MIRKWLLLCGSFLTILAIAGAAPVPNRAGMDGILPLKEGWKLMPATRVEEGGELLSKPGVDTSDWHSAKVPCTVLGALVDAQIYLDPFQGKDLDKINPAPFQGPWWYRTEFTLDGAKEQNTRLIFEGINYKANVWLNGQEIANKKSLYGTFRQFNLDVTGAVKEGLNVLAVEVFPPQRGEFIMGYVDWNPRPQDLNMGLFRAVKLRRTGAVSIEDVYVQSSVELKTLQEASLSITAELANNSDRAASGVLKGDIEQLHFEVPYTLKAREKKSLRLSPEQVPALRIKNPRLWWPLNLGQPNLYSLKLSAECGARTTDSRSVRFGIRDVGEYLTPEGARGYTVNGQKVLIRGAGWVDDMFLREDEQNLEAQFAYVKHMNLNTVRLEGFWGCSQKLYELADQNGILLWAGFSCEWEWPHYLGKARENPEHKYSMALNAKDADLLDAYLQDQVRWLRNHPSILTWVIGSDFIPLPEVEKRYRADLQELDPGRPVLNSCAAHLSTVSGPSGTKMSGPYDYVTPNYWWEDRHNGGAFGFNTETGPGAAIPPLASLKRMIPEDKLWPINDFWDFHCARGEFNDLRNYLKAYNARYGAAKSVQEFAFKAQAANYESMRAMFEAYGANRPQATGVIDWMLNSAFPKMVWQIYDYYLMPSGAFYGARKGCQPLNLVYDYANPGVVLVNDTLKALPEVAIHARLFDHASHQVFTKELKVPCAANGASRVLSLPVLDKSSPLYFLSLQLTGPDGAPLAENFYWLSVKPDVLDPENGNWYVMPNKSYGDFTALNALAPAKVKLESRFLSGSAEGSVTLTNTSNKLAFFLELQAVGAKSKEPILPVLWEDNDISLLPGESRTLKVRFPGAELHEVPVVELQGWNLE